MNLRPVSAKVSLRAIKHNTAEVRRLVGSACKIMAVVKAEAYGHGSVEVSRACLDAGADCLAVSMISEALLLRSNGLSCPILILGWTPEVAYSAVLDADITMTVYSLQEAKRLSKLAQVRHKRARVHLKIDTGMSRIGLMPDQAGLEAAAGIIALPGLLVEGIFSHFSKADEQDETFARQQLRVFLEFIRQAEEMTGYQFSLKHIANSAAIIDLPESYLDMVRPGIVLYGVYPSDEVQRENIHLKPTLCWMAQVSRVQALPAGTLVGYGGTFQAEREMLVATVPVGYADGYARRLGNCGFVACNGQLLPVVGRVCMDQFMVDASRLPDLTVGTEVMLIGRSGAAEVTVESLAQALETIPYEIFCNISARVPRIYDDAEN